MILKDKAETYSSSSKLDAGIKQEQDVAFYLRRAYKDNERVLVLNDLRIEHDDEVAQIDHLIIYTYGFVIVESKSIRGEVAVNEFGEWSRSYRGQWSGMPSPIKQAELQLQLLKRYLCANTEKVIGKFLGIQQGLGARCYDVLCAISSDAIINRANAPKDIAAKLVKSEFVVDSLNQTMRFLKFYQLIAKFVDTRPTFSVSELNQIGNFLLNGHTLESSSEASGNNSPWAVQSLTQNTKDVREHTKYSPVPSKQVRAQCKYCGEVDDLSAHSGRYGYFVQCGQCGKNTPLKRNCPGCGSQATKVRKSGPRFYLACSDCNYNTMIFGDSQKLKTTGSN